LRKENALRVWESRPALGAELVLRALASGKQTKAAPGRRPPGTKRRLYLALDLVQWAARVRPNGNTGLPERHTSTKRRLGTQTGWDFSFSIVFGFLPCVLGLLFPSVSFSTRADSVVVFNEIMYHPPVNEPALEWVELYNQMAVDVDLSGWSIAGGITYVFPEATVIPGGGYLVVASSPVDLMAATGLANVIGPFAGRLANDGERLELRNTNRRLMDEVSYDVEGDWPVGPDGAGVSLAKRDEDSGSSSASNWTVSPLVGGTPGQRNFALRPFELSNTNAVLINSTWKFDVSGKELGAAWRQVVFDDRDWYSGRALFRAGNVTAPVGEPQPVPTAFSSGVGDDGAVLPPGAADPHYWLALSAQSTPPPPPIAATVIQNHPAWAANDAMSSWIGPVNPGTANVAAGVYNYRTSFTLDGFDPATALLTVSVGADNRLNDLLLNGVPMGIAYVGFATMSRDFTITNGFSAGANTLDFLTANDGASPNPAGFRAKLMASARRQLALQTTMPTGRTNYCFRVKFPCYGAPEHAALTLHAVVADGAVFYVNGAEVLRWNMPTGLVTASTLALSNVFKPSYLGPFLLSPGNLVTGTNLLAAEVHQSPGDSDGVLFGASLAITLTNLLVPPPVTLAFNEVSPATNGDFWVELINYGATALELGGCVLARAGGATNGEYVIPPQVLAPGALMLVTRASLGFAPGDRLFLYSPRRSSVLDAVVAKARLRGRWPDGTGRWGFPTEATPGAANYFLFHNELVINEIMYHPPWKPVVPQSSESWIELFNRSSNAVDLTGWQLARDIQYDFPAGTTLSAGGYLVVAKDAAHMRSNYPGVTFIGPFTNNLRHSSSHVALLDPAGNAADEVRYFDGQPWPEPADGRGSSLELLDPWADNFKPAAWAASSEAPRSVWSNYTYRAIARNALGPTLWKEFVIGLLDAGECLIDDLSVVQSPSGTPAPMLQNGDFESGLTAWRALGNHSRSRVEADPDNPANHVLRLVATGPTGHMHNHLETTLAGGRSVLDGREYQVSFRAKWLGGNNRLNTRLYFNRVAKTSVLPLPLQQGTPGVRNSTFVTNIGPTFAAFGHAPAVPKPSEGITVSASASDPQGISALTLCWSANAGSWQTTPMQPGGPAAEPGYTNYAAALPGQPAGTLVQFYVQAADGLGAVATCPAGGRGSRALFKIDEGKPLMPQLHRFRLLMTPADANLLHASTNVMSNARLGLTVVYDERQVFYDAGVHLQGSERGRNDSSRVGFAVRLPADQPFRGVQNNFTLDRSGGYSGRGGRHDEILLWHAVNHAGGMPGINCDLAQVFAPRAQEDSTGLLRLSAFDGDYFDAQFDSGGNGNLYTLELIYYPTTTVTGDPQAPKLPQPDEVINVDLQDWGDDPENYRWIFVQENHADLDNHTRLIALNKAFGLTGAALETQTSRLLDVDEWLRTLAFKALTGDVDTYTHGLNHNWKIYFRPQDGKALGLLWDMDFSFVQGINSGFPGGGSATTYRFLTLPNNLRRYYNHLLDLTTTTVNQAYLGPWAARYAKLLGQDWSGAVNYLQQRGDYVRSAMPLTTAFAITSNGGNDFSTTNDRVALAGTAPLAVKDIEVNGVRYPLTWTSLKNWTLTVPLFGYANRLVTQGVDNYGNRLTNATDSVTVTNLGAPARLPPVINEWMADNAGPTGFPDPLDGRFQDWLELYNPNSLPLNLSGYFLSDAPAQPTKWPIPTNTVIAARGFLLVWADNQTNQNGLSPTGDLHAGFQLNNAGETVGLYAPDGAPQHTVTFGPQMQNVSQGLFPDGETNTFHFMTNWTPCASNRLGLPPAPQIDRVALQPEGAVWFAVSVVPGRTYLVEYKDMLHAPVWTPLGRERRATEPLLNVADTLGESSQRFYRVVLLP
jgi:hypothetical protein